MMGKAKTDSGARTGAVRVQCQGDSLKDLGADLGFRREAAGVSVEDLFEHTRINPGFIQAIESGNFDALPEAYTRLFVKNYAQAIGLDPQEVGLRYERILNPPEPPVEEEPEPPKKKPRRRLLMAGALGLALAAGAAWYWGLFGLRGAPPAMEGQETPRILFPPIFRTPEDTRPKQVFVADAYTMPPGPRAAEGDSILTLSARALEAARVSVFADGEEVFQGLMGSGSRLSWDAGRRFRLEVEAAQSLELLLEDRPLELRPDHKGRVRLYLTRSYVWVEEVEVRLVPTDASVVSR